MSRIIVAAIVIAWVNPVFAADGSIGRDAAIKKCNAESRMPRGKYYDWDSVWNSRYRSCMTDLGYRE